MEVTPLSRSVFAKLRIREILVDDYIGYSKADTSASSVPVHKNSQIANLKEKIAKKDEWIKKLVEENADL